MTELLVATGDELVRIRPQKDQWNAEIPPSARGMQCLASDPGNGDTLYAGSHGEGIWKSTNRGDDWTRLDLTEADVFSVAISPADGALYAGTEPSKLFVSRDEGRSWKELDALQQIPSRSSWSFPPRPWTSHVRSIAPSPDNSELLLVGIELGGIMRSEDGGQTWSDHPAGAQKDVHALAWHPSVPGRAYEAGGGGTAWSRDGGRSWQPADAGRDRHYTWGLALDPTDPDCWYVSANPGARLAHHDTESASAYIYRWRGTGPWQALLGGLPQPLESFPYALVMDSSSLYAGLGDGRIYRSDDGGNQWNQLDILGERPKSVRALIVLP